MRRRTRTQSAGGWHFYSRTKVSEAILSDYKDFIRSLPAEKRIATGDVSFFEDDSGQHAVSIELFAGRNHSRLYAIFYDQRDRRLRVTKYGYRKYSS